MNKTNWIQRILNRLGAPAGASVSADIAAIEALVDDLEGRLTATRAGYLDELDFDLQGLLNAIAGYLTTEIADILTDTGTTLPGLLATIQADLDNPSQYMADLTTLETRLSALRAGYLDQLDFALQEAIAAIPTTMVGTNNAALASAWTAALATALGNYTATRAGYLDELESANIPADIDGLKTSRGRQLFSLDFWSLPQEEVAIVQAAGDKALPSVTVADLPAGATIVRAIAMFKFRMVENHTYAGVNSLDGVQEIQVAASVDAINFVTGQFTLAQDTREGGDVVIGLIDISGTVNANGAYAFHWDLAKALQTGINFNDIAMGIRIWYSV